MLKSVMAAERARYGDTATPRAALVALAGAQSLVVLDSLPVAVALPSIADELALSATGAQWVVSAYMLTLAGGLLLGGRYADLVGRRRLLLAGVLLLTAATLLAGLAPGGPVLVLARFFQGLGAAATVPASLAYVPELFPNRNLRNRAFAAIAITDVVTGLAGAPFAGVVTDLLGWRFVFFATVPLGVSVWALGYLVLPESTGLPAQRRIDMRGAVSLSAGIAALVAGIVRIGHSGPFSRSSLVLLGSGALLLGAFVAIERRSSAPLIPSHVMRARTVRVACLGIAANGAGYSAAIFISTLYLQQVRGLSATAAGLAFLPVLGVGAVATVMGAQLLDRVAARTLAVSSLLVTTGALVTLAVGAYVAAPYPAVLMPALLLVGVGIYGAWLALVGQATVDVEVGHHGSATGAFQTSQKMAAVIAVASFAASIAAVDHAGRAGRPYAAAYLIGAGMTLLGAAAAWRLQPSAAVAPTDMAPVDQLPEHPARPHDG